MLTPRELQIANKLVASPTGLRVKDLAEELKVSPRTIQYDLENVKDFLGALGVQFRSGSGRGIWTEGTDSAREEALEELSRLEREGVYLNQQMRVRRIFLRLIFQEGYVTAGALAEELRVSRGTVLSDMDHMDALLAESGLALRRQARQGYLLTGREIALRTLAENLLQEGMSVYDIYRTISGLQAGDLQGELPLHLVGGEPADSRAAREAMAQAFAQQGALLQRENVVLLLIRLLISLSRVRMRRFVGSPTRPPATDRHYLSPYLESAYTASSLPVLGDEIDYILGRYQEEKLPVDVAALTAALVETVSELEGFPYYRDNTLYPRLLTHLRHNFSGDRRHTAQNPFHDVVLEYHRPLYESIRQVCKRYIDSAYLFPGDSLVSYLALHFLLSQRNLGVGRKLRAVFVCSTGRGAARLLERMLEAEVGRIQIVGHCSLTEVDEVVEQKRPDLIVSIFPIVSTVPVVLVEPLPTKANIEAIRRLVDELSEEDDPLYEGQPAVPRSDGERLEELSQEAILVGLKIYAGLHEDGDLAVKGDMEFAFLAHVMLLANRYVFDKQLGGRQARYTPLDLRIRRRLAELDIHLTPDEIKALSHYFSGGGDDDMET